MAEAGPGTSHRVRGSGRRVGRAHGGRPAGRFAPACRPGAAPAGPA